MNRTYTKFLPAYLVALLLLPSFSAFSLEQAKQKKAPAAQQPPEQEEPLYFQQLLEYLRAEKSQQRDEAEELISA